MVQITELAAQKVKEVLKNQNKENAFLRLYLAGVGCDSGCCSGCGGSC